MKLSCATFDIFDTVLTRRVAKPSDVFFLLADQLRESGIRCLSAGAFCWLRVRAERWARRGAEGGDVTIDGIYQLLAGILRWSASDRQTAMQTELDLESSLLVATPLGLRTVAKVRSEGLRVAFVSDMYLRDHFLQGLLEREGLWRKDDLLAVSCEWKSSKANGRVWAPLLAKLEVPSGEVLHQGDNPHSDVESPRRAGLSSARLGTAESSRWEEAPEGSGVVGIREFGGLAALSRLARAECSSPDDYWTCLGSGMLGPMLAGFARWTLDQAREDGVETLWFLSRDGWLFHQAAQSLARPGDPRLVYLGINRRQLQLALGQAPGIDEVSLFEGSRQHTLRLVASRLALDVGTLSQLAEEVGLAPEAVLDRTDKGRVIELLRTPVWEGRRRECLSKASGPVKGYLEQEFSAAKGQIGVVDVGWKGRSQDLLDQLSGLDRPLMGYYLGLTRRPQVTSAKKGWLFDLARGEGAMALDRHERLFEVLVGGVSGPLRGYVKGAEGWQPDFEAFERGEAAPGREEAQAAAHSFVAQLNHERYQDWWNAVNLKAFAICNLNRLFERPTLDDAGRFLDWTISTDEAHLDSVPLAQGYDFRRIRACVQKQEPWGWIWPQASLRNSPGSTRWLMQLAARYNKIRAQRVALAD